MADMIRAEAHAAWLLWWALVTIAVVGCIVSDWHLVIVAMIFHFAGWVQCRLEMLYGSRN